MTPRTPLRSWEAADRKKSNCSGGDGKGKEMKDTPVFPLPSADPLYKLSTNYSGYLHSWEPLRRLWLSNVSFCFVSIVIRNSVPLQEL